MPTESDGFISYATDTKPLAEELTRALQKQGIHTWSDFKDLQPGQRWQDELDHALDQAQSFLILVSPQSRSTPFLEAEWRAALTKVWSDSSKRMIPIVVGGNEAPAFLRHWVPLRIDPAAEPAKWIKDVLRAIRSRNNATRALTSKDRQLRQQRFDELARAAEAMRSPETVNGELPDSKS